MKQKILIIDDDEHVRKVMERYLKHHGFEVYAFASPLEIPCMRNDGAACPNDSACSDIIISDVLMPEFSGIDFIHRLSFIKCKCRHLALMSGAWSHENFEAAKKLNCMIFHKPMDLAKLCEWINDCK